MDDIEITENDEGVWLDGNRGRYIGEAIQQRAVDYGWDGELADADDDAYDDATYEAEEYLNTLAPEGFYFGMSEQGDWGLWSVDEDET